jgi:hypothetical protein
MCSSLVTLFIILTCAAASVAWQHALHRLLVFGKSLSISREYFTELGSTYLAYSLSFVLMPLIAESFIAFAQLAWKAAAPAQVKAAAFWVSLGLTGVLNYFTVTAVFNRSKK